MNETINNKTLKPSSSESKPVDVKTSWFSSKKLWIFIIIIVIIILALIMFLYFNSTKPIIPYNNNLEVLDCGTDMNCFIESAATCSLSKVNYNSILTQYAKIAETDVIIISTSNFTLEIKGYESSKCVINKITNNAEITYGDEYINQLLSSGRTSEDIEKQRQVQDTSAKKAIGQGNICKVNLNYLTTYLNNLKENTSASIDPNFCVTTKDGVIIDSP
ncbi:MAG: hypothetical protein WCF78_04315 [archaeon]